MLSWNGNSTSLRNMAHGFTVHWHYINIFIHGASLTDVTAWIFITFVSWPCSFGLCHPSLIFFYYYYYYYYSTIWCVCEHKSRVFSWRFIQLEVVSHRSEDWARYWVYWRWSHRELSGPQQGQDAGDSYWAAGRLLGLLVLLQKLDFILCLKKVTVIWLLSSTALGNRLIHVFQYNFVLARKVIVGLHVGFTGHASQTMVYPPIHLWCKK